MIALYTVVIRQLVKIFGPNVEFYFACVLFALFDVLFIMFLFSLIRKGIAKKNSETVAETEAHIQPKNPPSWSEILPLIFLILVSTLGLMKFPIANIADMSIFELNLGLIIFLIWLPSVWALFVNLSKKFKYDQDI